MVRQHLAAFNAGDLSGLMAGFAADAVWRTGATAVRGRAQLAELFAGALRDLRPELTLRTLVATGDRVACELTELLHLPAGARTDAIAGFYLVRGGRITAAHIYREGSAEA